MLFLIQKLDNCGLLCLEIWQYLTIQDISHLLVVDKNVRLISLLINKQISQQISISLYCLENKQQLVLQNIFRNFPNIYNLIVKIHQPIKHHCMATLYNTKSISSSLKHLTIPLSDDNTGGISNLSIIQILNISFSTISKINGLIEISSMTNITSLDISQCIEINNEVLSPLSTMTNLKNLYMQHCIGITNHGLQHLSTLTKLEYLDLSYNSTKISDAGVLFLTNLVNLNTLNLQVCQIRSLSFSESFINITSLNLTYCNKLSNHGFSSILCLNKLTDLELCNCELLTDEGLCHLSKMFELKSINFSSCKITSLSFLTTLVNLKSLDLNNCTELTNQGFSSISHLTNLTNLNLSNSNNNINLFYLSNLKNLTKLNLYSSSCSQLSFLNNLVNITNLNLVMCNNLTDQYLNSISNLTNLELLSIYRCEKLTKTGSQILKKISHDNNLDFGNYI